MEDPHSPPPSQRIIALALQIAAAAPRKHGRYAYGANIPWRLILELREALEAAGIDWDGFKRDQERDWTDLD